MSLVLQPWQQNTAAPGKSSFLHSQLRKQVEENLTLKVRLPLPPLSRIVVIVVAVVVVAVVLQLSVTEREVCFIKINLYARREIKR